MSHKHGKIEVSDDVTIVTPSLTDNLSQGGTPPVIKPVTSARKVLPNPHGASRKLEYIKTARVSEAHLCMLATLAERGYTFSNIVTYAIEDIYNKGDEALHCKGLKVVRRQKPVISEHHQRQHHGKISVAG